MADGDDPDVLQKLLGKPGTVSIKPIKDDEPLRLTTNKDRIIRLDKDASSVIVNNPAHAVVMLDSPRLLIVMPRQPGATSFSVLDGDGNTILHKEIIVTNVQPQYVRIRRMCNGSDPTCVPNAYFYCPDGCYEVTAVGDASGNANITAPVGGAPPAPGSVPGVSGGGPGGPPIGAPQNPVSVGTAPAGFSGTSP